jgi:uncharacterized coiled-coil protein SlyX
MRIVTFFKDAISSLWRVILENSKCISCVLATLIVSFSFYIYQEVNFATERLEHSIEKASLVHNLREAEGHIGQQNQTMFIMDRVIKQQNSIMTKQDAIIKELIKRLNDLIGKKNSRGLEI